MTDDELMTRIASGDHRAFKVLFDRHSGKVFGYARRLMKDPERAEDVSQEVWLKVVKVASQYTPTSKFIAWLFTIVRNTSFNQLRNQKAFKEDTTENLYESEKAEFELERSSVDEILAQQEDARKIRKKIDDLPDNQRILLMTWMTEELSYDDLARETGLSVSAVKSLLFRAKKNLEKSLKGVL